MPVRMRKTSHIWNAEADHIEHVEATCQDGQLYTVFAICGLHVWDCAAVFAQSWFTFLGRNDETIIAHNGGIKLGRWWSAAFRLCHRWLGRCALWCGHLATTEAHWNHPRCFKWNDFQQLVEPYQNRFDNQSILISILVYISWKLRESEPCCPCLRNKIQVETQRSVVAGTVVCSLLNLT